MMNNILSIIGRKKPLFDTDIQNHEIALSNIVSNATFLVLGGAGSIGQAVTKEIFKRNPEKLYVVDINENNLVELVRDIRSSFGYIKGDFKTFALDIGSLEYNALIRKAGKFDFVLNLSALKHVRSEKDPFTLMRMIDVNILNTNKSIQQAIDMKSKKYFCVSTDKATNPVNMMGASKRIMEMFLSKKSKDISISTARFANVAFSDGSLLHSFNQRIKKHQPLVAPKDIKRYFVTAKEAGELCLMSCIFGENGDIFFPKLSERFHLVSFADIADNYLKKIGYKSFVCETEEQARQLVHSLPQKGFWPCLFTLSDTTGEKNIEEFFTENETLDMERFVNLGIVKNKIDFDLDLLTSFEATIIKMKTEQVWTKTQLVDLFFKMIPSFNHKETRKYLDDKM